MLKFKLARMTKFAFVRADCVTAVVEGPGHTSVTIHLTGGTTVEIEADCAAAAQAVALGLDDPRKLIDALPTSSR